MNEVPDVQMLSAGQVLRIAQADAIKVYRDLLVYRICLEVDQEGWHVDYELKDPKLMGGGAHYVIDLLTGISLSKRYLQ
jgi:hypothetical protein